MLKRSRHRFNLSLPATQHFIYKKKWVYYFFLHAYTCVKGKLTTLAFTSGRWHRVTCAYRDNAHVQSNNSHTCIFNRSIFIVFMSATSINLFCHINEAGHVYSNYISFTSRGAIQTYINEYLLNSHRELDTVYWIQKGTLLSLMQYLLSPL